MKISLTKNAEKPYKSIKEYIKYKWGETVVHAFEEKTIDFLTLLRQ
jgi:hypothetical protein